MYTKFKPRTKKYKYVGKIDLRKATVKDRKDIQGKLNTSAGVDNISFLLELTNAFQVEALQGTRTFVANNKFDKQQWIRELWTAIGDTSDRECNQNSSFPS